MTGKPINPETLHEAAKNGPEEVSTLIQGEKPDDHEAIADRAQQALKLLGTQVEKMRILDGTQQVLEKHLELAKESQKQQIENVRRSVLDQKRAIATPLEQLPLEAKEATRDIQMAVKEKDWLTLGKYGGAAALIGLGVGYLTKQAWNAWNWVRGRTANAWDWLTAAGAGVLAAGAGVLGISRWKNSAEPYGDPKTTLGAAVGIGSGVVDEAARFGGRTVEVGKENAQLFGDVVKALGEQKYAEAAEICATKGLSVLWEDGKYVLYELAGGRVIDLDTQVIEKFINWGKTGKPDQDIWYVWGASGFCYVIGQKAWKTFITGSLGIRMMSKTDAALTALKVSGRLVAGPLAPAADLAIGAVGSAATLSKAEGGKALKIVLAEKTVPGKLLTPLFRPRLMNLKNEEDILKGIEYWKAMKQNLDIKERFSKGIGSWFNETDVTKQAELTREYAARVRKGIQGLPQSANESEKMRQLRKIAFAGDEEFMRELDLLRSEWVAGAQEEKLISSFAKSVEKPIERFKLIRKELDNLYTQKQAFAKNAPELPGIESKIAKLEAENKALQQEFQKVLANAEAKLPQEAAEALRGKMAENILGRSLTAAEQKGVLQIHIAGETEFQSAIGKLQKANPGSTFDANEILRASPQEIQLKYPKEATEINKAKMERIRLKAEKMDELTKSKIWGIDGKGKAIAGLDVRAERRLLFESGVTGNLDATETVAKSGTNTATKVAETAEATAVLRSKLLALGANADDTAILNALKQGGAEERIIARFETFPDSLKTVRSAIATGNPQEVDKTLRLASKASKMGIPLQMLGIGADAFSAYMAYQDLLENDMKLENAKKTGNTELKKLYENAHIIHMTSIGVNSTAVVIGAFAFVSSAAATASFVVLPAAAVITIGIEGYKQAEAIAEDIYRTYRDYEQMQLSPSQLLVQIKEKSESNPRALGSALISMAAWTNAESVGRNANDGQLPELCLAYLLKTAQISPSVGESEKKFKQRQEIYIRDALQYLSKEGLKGLSNPEIFSKARKHAELCAQSRDLQKMKEDREVSWTESTGQKRSFNLRDYAKASETREGQQSNWDERRYLVDRLQSDRFGTLAETISATKDAQEKRQEGVTHFKIQRTLLLDLQDDINELRKRMEEPWYGDIGPGTNIGKRVAVVMASRMIRDALKKETDGLIAGQVSTESVNGALSRMRSLIRLDANHFYQEGKNVNLASLLRAESTDPNSWSEKFAKAVPLPGQLLLAKAMREMDSEGLEQLELGWIYEHLRGPQYKPQPLDTQEKQTMGATLAASLRPKQVQEDGTEALAIEGKGKTLFVREREGKWEWKLALGMWQLATFNQGKVQGLPASPGESDSDLSQWNHLLYNLALVNNGNQFMVPKELQNLKEDAGTRIDRPYDVNPNNPPASVLMRGDTFYMRLPKTEKGWSLNAVESSGKISGEFKPNAQGVCSIGKQYSAVRVAGSIPGHAWEFTIRLEKPSAA